MVHQMRWYFNVCVPVRFARAHESGFGVGRSLQDGVCALFGDDSLDEREVVGVDGSENILLILLSFGGG